MMMAAEDDTREDDDGEQAIAGDQLSLQARLYETLSQC